MSDKTSGLLAAPDRVLLRLNKLLATPGGLSAFLSTFNYTLYLLTHLETKANPLKTRLALLLNRSTTTPKIIPAVPTGPSSIAALGALLSQTRTNLRLFSVLPLYAWMRQLMRGPKPGEDPVLYATAVTQCAFYLAYQSLENIGTLADAKVIPATTMARWAASANGSTTTTQRIYLWSYRTWLIGVACDFVRLGREKQLELAMRARRTAAEVKDVENFDRDREVDAKWWADLIVPLGWLPVAYHYAAVNEGGIPGWNLGIMGVCGGVAGLARFLALWRATA